MYTVVECDLIYVEIVIGFLHLPKNTSITSHIYLFGGAGWNCTIVLLRLLYFMYDYELARSCGHLSLRLLNLT